MDPQEVISDLKGQITTKKIFQRANKCKSIPKDQLSASTCYEAAYGKIQRPTNINKNQI